jgi:hypothetical protein
MYKRVYNPHKIKLDSRTISEYFIACTENSEGYRFYCLSCVTRVEESKNSSSLRMIRLVRLVNLKTRFLKRIIVLNLLVYLHINWFCLMIIIKI